MSIKILPSILSADFTILGREVADVVKAGADEIHVDVMDGRFVPNITIGPPVVKCLKRVTAKPLDVHLMIVEPDKYVADFIQAGADILLVHQEACLHLDRTLALIRDLGAKAGVTLNPATPLESLTWVMDKLDRVLLMTVNPGFGGQSFIPASLDKIKALRRMIDESGYDIDLSVDGGINSKTLASVVEAGIDSFVAGSAIYNTQDYAATIAELRQIIASAG